MNKATFRFLFALTLLCVSAPWRDACATDTERKNVVLLIADDLNSWLLGDPERYTGKVVAPNLLKLADSGVNFTRAYTASPVCSPSRTAFFSGLAPWTTGHYHNALKVSESEPLKGATSLASFFKKAGYSTYSFGKITHGWDQRDAWDINVGHKRDPAPPGYPLTPIGRGEHDWGPIHLPEAKMNDTMNVTQAIEILQQDHSAPFFLACGTFNPHMPWYVPQKYFDLFPLDEITLPEIREDDLDDVPPTAVDFISSRGRATTEDTDIHRSAVQAYLATTAYVDHQMGRLLEALDDSPHRDSTIVVFISDHGFHLGEKHHWQKATLWEEATHCLMMIRVPGLTPEGQPSERFVSLLDLYPTLAELTDLEAPDNLDGRSLVPLLKNPQAKWQSTAITGITNKSQPDSGYLTIRHELGRYIHYRNGEEEYYDTTKDPHEWTNQSDNANYADTIETLRAALPPESKRAPALPSGLPDKKARKESKK